MKKIIEWKEKVWDKNYAKLWVFIIFICMISSGIHLFHDEYAKATFSLGLVILAKLNLNDIKTK
ncbi:hypothetical protein vBBak6_075 [Bacillus phage v_B-Bak6]|uniref:Uncharacterized protein n=2 Tax=Basiliskvirus TaxID=3044670 RepID=A0A385IK54_9CAUD|nr:hypothetical protein PP653_gp083 [Bacillus phage Basilisk]YP_010656979.1 hypothetical protein PP654_gp070 [Bacillus phage v_B-Bak10]AXY83035.1 hypothetical protein vBBak1_075 [Bacillus phage v_B-Bak1]AXY83155.1 hypothetical protein vBBak6_075 [Bacillus phage v_B-Bak6]AGR46628.1 hypothetical protein BASILISK_84 [Bacillus phage Basilisk]AXY83294.1 hypothetical protein vBBBak10_072 [Bacillus phage v_B-Bak10]